jgi:hypothetical protein
MATFARLGTEIVQNLLNLDTRSDFLKGGKSHEAFF